MRPEKTRWRYAGSCRSGGVNFRNGARISPGRGPEGLRPAGRSRKPDQADASDALAEATRDKLGALEWISATPNKRTGLIEKAGGASIGDEADLVITPALIKRESTRAKARAGYVGSPPWY
jgi:hypothetical protein